jgi:hypothetical protein
MNSSKINNLPSFVNRSHENVKEGTNFDDQNYTINYIKLLW